MRYLLILTAVLFFAWTAYPYLIPPQSPQAGDGIVIRKDLNRLYLFQHGKLQKVYPAATGREVELTPEGEFLIAVKEADEKGLGKDKVFGTRWMGLNVPGDEDGLRFGIHGTNEPDSIGKYASAGCIRLSNQDAEELYDQVSVGTPVRIMRGSRIHRLVTDWLKTKVN